MLCTSVREAGVVFGLSRAVERAGLGSSLGAGDGRTTGLNREATVSGLSLRCQAARQRRACNTEACNDQVAGLLLTAAAVVVAAAGVAGAGAGAGAAEQ